ncbi:hypothetical protein [Pseudomonas fluorescens]|uniref:hypothetical protein n=1 Tax=Pseudomonas fluorescens TaxID=294 RepID=UPI003812622A
MTEPPIPFPLFPPYMLFDAQAIAPSFPLIPAVCRRLTAFDRLHPELEILTTWRAALDFMITYRRKIHLGQDAYNRFSRALELMLNWSWYIRKIPLSGWRKDDAVSLVKFELSPPSSWLSSHTDFKFSSRDLTCYETWEISPQWRPLFRSSRRTASGRSRLRHIDHLLSVYHHCFRYLRINPDCACLDAYDVARLVGCDISQEAQVIPPVDLDRMKNQLESLADRDSVFESVLFLFAMATLTRLPLSAILNGNCGSISVAEFERTATGAARDTQRDRINWLSCDAESSGFAAYYERYKRYRLAIHGQYDEIILLPSSRNNFEGFSGDGFQRYFRRSMIKLFEQSDFLRAQLTVVECADINFGMLRRSAYAAGWLKKRKMGSRTI